MKRILIVSDTHGDIGAAIDCYESAGRLDGIIHLGDKVKDAEDLASISGLPVVKIRGNCDLGDTDVPEATDVIVDGFNFHCVHGHIQGVKFGYSGIADYAKSTDCDVLLFGHTHKQEYFWVGKVLCVNPGSISRPRGDSSRGCAIAESDGRSITIYLHDLDEKTCFSVHFQKKCK